jgi:hypothetical protein
MLAPSLPNILLEWYTQCLGKLGTPEVKKVNQPKSCATLSSLYQEDETAWLEMTSRLLAERRFQELDHENLSEYLADMAKRDKREVLSRLSVLIAHLLKWEFQADQRSKSWEATIALQRQELHELLEGQTLRSYAAETLTKAYNRGLQQAAIDTGLAESAFPAECALTMDSILGDE